MTTKNKKDPLQPPVQKTMEAPPHPLQSFGWVLALLIAFFLNISVLDNGFVWDDYDIFEHQISRLTTVRDIFFPGEKVPELIVHYFRPLVLASYRFDYSLWGKTPKGFHLTVLLSHCLNTVLVYFLGLLIASGIRSRHVIALFSAALFAVHPVHAEVTAWICGRNDSFATGFVLLALITYILFRQKNNYALLFASAASFLAGLFCKELAASFLFLVLLYDLCFREKQNPSDKKGRTFFAYALFIAIFVFYYILRYLSLGKSGATVLNQNDGVLQSLICAVGYYGKVLFLPFNLNFFIAKIPSSGMILFLSAAALAIILLAAGKCLITGPKIIAFSILFVLLALAPSLAIAVMYISETPIALRYAYLPSVGFVLTLGYFLGNVDIGSWPNIPLAQKAKWLVFLVIFAMYVPLNIRAIKTWKDDVSLWTDITRRSPDEGLPYNELGRAYAVLGKHDLAIKYAKISLEKKYNKEGKAIACNMLGYSYLALNQLEEAERWYQKAIELQPNDYALPYFNIGFIGLRREEQLSTANDPADLPRRQQILERSLPFLQKAIEIYPHYYKARYHLGICYLRMNRNDLAKEQFLKLLEQDPTGEWAKPAQDILRQMK